MKLIVLSSIKFIKGGVFIMIIDCHIHTRSLNVNKNGFLQKLNAAGVDGGVILSMSPNSFHRDKLYTFNQRLDDVMSFTASSSNLYPFFFIDPLEEDAIEQVDVAVGRGVAGFKVICNEFYPGDKRAMEVFKAIAKAKKPILFHSGILFDGAPSSQYNRPAEFEALFKIEGLKFALAHVSWPWTDENIAVYGKFLHSGRKFKDLGGEMFIDLTPGTPPIYRKEVLTKLFTVGYDVEDNIIYGIDANIDDYNSQYAKQWIERDNKIYQELNLNENTLKKIYSENLKRFMGIA